MESSSVAPDGIPGVPARKLPNVTHARETNLIEIDLICFSHLRWDFVTQRPQHLLRRAARNRRVFYWEEPMWHAPDATSSSLTSVEIQREGESIWILKPHLAYGQDPDLAQRQLLDTFLNEHSIDEHVRWYYTPMALSFSSHLSSAAVVYDCMDELTGFLGAPPELSLREQELFTAADVIFTGGISLYESKRKQHHSVFAYPSSIDQSHFSSAMNPLRTEPEDQSHIPHPRAGFFGVIDERLDIDLLAKLASLRPDLHLIILGPVVKIDPARLPQQSNIHYLGSKQYEDLPSYIAGWDVALLPFALNESTRFISPTKTPEYLAAGKPVVSTPIHDVVRTYGEAGLVAIADTAIAFAHEIDLALQPRTEAWQNAVSRVLSTSSWDSTWSAMNGHLHDVQANHSNRPTPTADSESMPKYQASHNLVPSLARAHFSHILTSSSLKPRAKESFDYLVVGAGFAGSVLAERLASELGKKVLIVDKRDHIAGNAYDHYDASGILVHKYGPHIFHTNSESVVAYLSRFTEWRPYEHRVLASVSDQLLPVPINLDTINKLYGLNLDSDGMRSLLNSRIIKADNIRTSEQIVISRVGRELYELFFRNYTRKQWGLDPSQLDASVAGRIPVRFDRDARYFTDTFQAMPLRGYTAMFERLLDHPGITIRTGTSYDDIAKTYPKAKIIFTGPIDEYFEMRYGPLPYRSLEFKHETHDQEQYQSAPVINYPNEHAYTRVTEFKYLTGQQHSKTSIVYEYPQASGDPYYPIPRPENTALYERYRELAKAKSNVEFCGRLANYRYFNMDQVVAQALTTFSRIAETQGLENSRKGTIEKSQGVKALPGLATALTSA